MATGLGPNGRLHEREAVALPRPGSRPYLRTEAPGTVSPFPSRPPACLRAPQNTRARCPALSPILGPCWAWVLGNPAAVHKPGLTPMGGTVWGELPDPEAQGEW